MATAYTYTFSKRHNSTAQPTGGTSVTVNLKGGCDLIAPIFVLSMSGTPTFNYMSFEGRFYFVTGIKSVRQDLWEISCEVDALATWKSAILAMHPYVLYYTHNNTEIVDRRLSTKTSVTLNSSTETFNNLGSGQAYMITAVGRSRTTVFACDQGDVDDLFDSNILDTIQDGWDDMVDDVNDTVDAIVAGSVEDMLKGLFKAWLKYIQTGSKVESAILYSDQAQKFVKNCYVLPIDKSNIGGSDHTIRLGKWDSNASGNMAFPRICHDSATVSIPWQASDWRRNAPYHEIYLYIPYIGLIAISASEVIGVTNLTVNVSVDTYSGVTTFVVNADNGAIIGQYSTNIAAPYAIGSSNISITESGAQIVASAAAIAAGAVSGNVAGVAMGALGVVNAIKPFDASISSNGGAAGMGLGNTVKCFTVFHDTTVSPSSVSAEKGTPYNGVLSLSNVTGYVQTMGASVLGAMTDTEREKINQLMDGGIYIE